jgi:phosphatidylethanolamine/phosphatidyl-N-methylethanolamine N-methyltransferase
MRNQTATDRQGWLSDEVRFLRTWIARPKIVGAIAPSGRTLARAMAAAADISAPGLVLELGPGTGVVTEALVERGIAPERIVAVEFDSGFCSYLRERFPTIRVIEGNAFAVDTALPPDLRGPFSAVISSLPLVLSPPAERRRLVEDMLARIPPRGTYIQFSYSPKPPVLAVPGLFSAEHGPWIVNNIPPARVWTYRRAR